MLAIWAGLLPLVRPEGLPVWKRPLFGEGGGLPPFILALNWTQRRQQHKQTVGEVWKELLVLSFSSTARQPTPQKIAEARSPRARKGKKRCTPGFSTEHGGSRRNGAARKRGGSAVGRKGLGGCAEWTAERTAHTGNFLLAREEFRPAGCATGPTGNAKPYRR